MIRFVLSTRRVVPLDRTDEYLQAWERIRAQADAVGGRAWLFRAVQRDDQFIEFLEGAPDTVLHSPALVSAREALEAEFGFGVAEEWEEAPAYVEEER
jgi:hypothetical protein